MGRRLLRTGPATRTHRAIVLRVLLGCLVLAPVAAGTGSTAPAANPPTAKAAAASRALLPAAKLNLVAFRNSPFPWYGLPPGTDKPFFNLFDGKRRGHTTEYGGVYWEHPTYSERRSLLYLPKGFDLSRPALLIVFLHGNQSVLLRDVRDRQQVPRQLAESGLNAALIAPQFALDAFDSSAGRFWEKNGFAKYLDEAADHLAALHGGKGARARFATAPVVLVAYSGGYQPAAYAADIGGVDNRLRGMILLDAPYGEEDILASWLARRHADSFFVSAHGMAPREYNANLIRLLSARGTGLRHTLPASLTPGTIVFFDSGDRVAHEDFVTHAWVDDPLRHLLSLIPGFARSDNALQSGERRNAVVTEGGLR